MTWRRSEAGSTLIDRPKDAPVPDFTNGKERANRMTWRRGEAGSTLIDRPKDAPVPDFTNGKERVIHRSVNDVDKGRG